MRSEQTTTAHPQPFDWSGHAEDIVFALLADPETAPAVRAIIAEVEEANS